MLSAISDKNKWTLVSALKKNNNSGQVNIHISSNLTLTHINTHFHPASIHPCDFMDTIPSINPGDGIEGMEDDLERIGQ